MQVTEDSRHCLICNLKAAMTNIVKPHSAIELKVELESAYLNNNRGCEKSIYCFSHALCEVSFVVFRHTLTPLKMKNIIGLYDFNSKLHYQLCYEQNTISRC